MALFYPFCGEACVRPRHSYIAIAIQKCLDAESSYDLRPVGLLIVVGLPL
jgi:hypothetical protein